MSRLEDRAKKGRKKAFKDSTPETKALLRVLRYFANRKKEKPGSIGTG